MRFRGVRGATGQARGSRAGCGTEGQAGTGRLPRQREVSGGQERGAPDALPTVVYLGGLGRSGTTLIERLLAELPGACSVGEVVHMWQRGVLEQERCGCGRPFGQCDFWHEVGAAAFGGWDRLDVRRVTELRAAVDRNRRILQLAGPLQSAVFKRRVSEYTAHYLRLYSAIGRVSGCPVVVDSSKHPSLAFCLRERPELDLRVIHVVRDSRAVAYSWTRRVSRPDSADPSYMATYSPAAAAREWNVHNGALQLLARRGVPTLRVRYEDFVADPPAVLTLMARFAGLDIGRGDLAFVGADDGVRWARLGAGHTASGNPMRFSTGQITISPDERWRSAMPATQRRAVTALTFPLLAQYGYARRAA
jgi:Sulfotransferase family